ncbi:sensor histidine kinase [Tumebacillus flagellatus]|uniref:histidine kinase n=1 Tax=Tumebacillus flagellatus TaxID=1157490 RepID=A0A074LPU0_9BACL|nr:sensor histidine kinase [Tumebacillus flagellatus]KEO81878.1 hypothetical protein EL26_18750 [Tumebacillus flagellatus]
MIGKFEFFPKRVGKFIYFNLIYWVLGVYNLLHFSDTTTKALLGLSLSLLFLIAYRESFWAEEKPWKGTVFLPVQVLIVCVWVAFYNENFCYMTFFCGSVIGFMQSKKRMWGSLIAMLVAVTVAILIAEGQGQWGDIFSLIPFYLTNIMFPFSMRAMRIWKEQNEELQAANAQIEHLSKHAERQRIARDLHDTMGHALSMITLKSELAEKLAVRDPERAAREMRDVQTASRAALSQVRELVANMHMISLPDELQNIRRILDAAHIELHVHGTLEELRLNTSTSSILALCLREAVTNVVRHSRARICRVTLQDDAAGTIMRIVDDGRGWKEKGNGHGLLGMRQRVDVVGGTLHLETAPNGGAALTVTLPHIISGQKGD